VLAQLDRRIARLPNGEELHFPANTSNEVMDRTVQSHMAHTAMEQGRQTNAAAPQRGLGESVARVVSQIDTVTVVFLLLPSLLCIAFVSLFQYLVLGFFSPLALFRSRK
jgi:Flp pilus assembly protein TadB